MPVRYGLIEPADLSLPQLPRAADRLRMAHLTDLHIGRRRPPRRRIDRLANQLTTLRLDLVMLTGDYMNQPGDEAIAAELLERLCAKLRPNIGTFGVFGNHDTDELAQRVADLPVHWLHNQAASVPGLPVEILGLDMSRQEDPDSVALALDWQTQRSAAMTQTQADASPPRPLRIMLTHMPSCLTTAADMGVDLMLSGHTHGGQIRFPRFSMRRGAGRALVNACDLPLRMSAGVLRHRRTLGVISRGLGEVGFPRRRFCCPPHAPVYTLHHRSMPGRESPDIDLIEAW